MCFICHGQLTHLNEESLVYYYVVKACYLCLTVAEGSWLSVISWRSPRGLTLRKRRRECRWDPSLCRAPSSLSLVFSTCKEAVADISASWLNIQFFQITESLWRRRRLILDHIYALQDDEEWARLAKEIRVRLDRPRAVSGRPQFPVQEAVNTQISSLNRQNRLCRNMYLHLIKL